MKIGFRKGTIHEVERAGSNGLIVAYRTGKLIRTMNLAFEPKDAFTLINNDTENELIIKIKLVDGEFLVIEDQSGEGEKGLLE